MWNNSQVSFLSKTRWFCRVFPVTTSYYKDFDSYSVPVEWITQHSKAKKDTSKLILNSRAIQYCMQMEISEHKGTDL